MSTPIPSPPGLPLLGNFFDINLDYPLGSLLTLAGRYGSIYKVTLGGQDRVVVSSVALMNELCDEKRFEKVIAGGLKELRMLVHDGLFTAFSDEHNWEIAHRTLVPAFGPTLIQDMFEDMHDIASQLVLKWARFGPEHKIFVTDDFTRLTLDSIAIAAMGTRFNSFYTNEMHPFVNSMVEVLVEAGQRGQRPAFADRFLSGRKYKYEQDIAYQRGFAKELLNHRRQHPTDKKDLLNAMIKGKDPKTGEALREESIIDNMITFLIAGHETTSGLLSFLFYNLLKNPSALQRARAEVDEVVGESPVKFEHLKNIPYINACLRETLRLTPTAIAFSVSPKQDEVVGGEYMIKKGTPMICLLSAVHRDVDVYGEDAETFNPERMLDEPFHDLPPNAWKPFGNGQRACIGRPFAWQEAQLAVVMLLQNFDFTLDDPSYQLEIKQTLTIKPKDFYIRASLRRDYAIAGGSPESHHTATASKNTTGQNAVDANAATMSIFYGSNTGTCESMATALASAAASHGYKADVNILDKAVEIKPKAGPVVIITASYEGEPPDNAVHFVNWLEGLKGKELSGLKYAVFGCGNRDWAKTYQRIPTLVDFTLEERGAERLIERGTTDANEGRLFDDFDQWQDDKLWPAVQKAFGKQNRADEAEDDGLALNLSTSSRSTLLRQDVQDALVTDSKVLSAPGVARKMHTEIRLPTGCSYTTGDYLAVLPLNPVRNVRRAIKRFNLPWDATVKIKPTPRTSLPVDREIGVFNIFSAYVELAQPVTLKQATKVAQSIPDEGHRTELETIIQKSFKEDIQSKNLSLLDLLERYPSAAFTLGQFLDSVPTMRVRQYSISSSPLADPTTCTLTYSVLDSPMLGDKSKRYLGVASNYLAQCEPGDNLHIAVRPSAGFHPPRDDSTPVQMICAGTGLAPFRGFIQERALKIEAGQKLGPALLFYGCGSPDEDAMYTDELKHWQSIGAVDVRYAFSRAPKKSEGCKHVQDRLWKDREEAAELFRNNAMVYVCGSGGVGATVNETIKKIYVEIHKEVSEEQAEDWIRGLKGERYWADIFA